MLLSAVAVFMSHALTILYIGRSDKKNPRKAEKSFPRRKSGRDRGLEAGIPGAHGIPQEYPDAHRPHNPSITHNPDSSHHASPRDLP